MFHRNTRAFWNHAKQISDLFRSLKPLTREDREELWSEFRTICDDVKEKQESEWQNRKIKSSDHRNFTLREAELARPRTILGFMAPDIEEMKQLGRRLQNASQAMAELRATDTR